MLYQNLLMTMWNGEIHLTEMARITRKSRTILYRWRALNWLRPTCKVGNSERFSYLAYEQACKASLRVQLRPEQQTTSAPATAPTASASERIRSAFGK